MRIWDHRQPWSWGGSTEQRAYMQPMQIQGSVSAGDSIQAHCTNVVGGAQQSPIFHLHAFSETMRFLNTPGDWQHVAAVSSSFRAQLLSPDPWADLQLPDMIHLRSCRCRRLCTASVLRCLQARGPRRPLLFTLRLLLATFCSRPAIGSGSTSVRRWELPYGHQHVASMCHVPFKSVTHKRGTTRASQWVSRARPTQRQIVLIFLLDTPQMALLNISNSTDHAYVFMEQLGLC